MFLLFLKVLVRKLWIELRKNLNEEIETFTNSRLAFKISELPPLRCRRAIASKSFIDSFI